MKGKLLGFSLIAGMIALAVLGSSQARSISPGIKVGVFLSSSGPLYFAGAFQKAGCELAKEESNVSCFYADAGETELQAKAAYKQLVSRGVDLLIAPLETESVKRILKFNQSNPIPVIAASAIGEVSGAIVKDKNWFFRLATTSNQDVAILADYLSKDKADSVLILVGPEPSSKASAKFLQLSLALRGVGNVQQFSLTDLRNIRESNPDTVVMLSMESSVDFLEELSSWFRKIQTRFLVPGNLANYSMYSWARNLQGAKALVPNDQIAAGFRESVASYLHRPNLLAAPNSSVFSLSWKTHQAILLADSIRGDIREGLETSKQLFSSKGYYLGQKYNFYGYGTAGTFSLIGPYQPDTP